MRSSILAGLAAGAVLGGGGIVAADLATEPAEAQGGGFTLTTGQLKINQNISSAAVRRSNRSLNYLAPIRTQQTDNADDGSNGVRPLSTVPGSGQGWTNSQIANEAINSEKIAPGGVTSGDLANNSVTGEKIVPGGVGQNNLSQDVQSQLQTIYTAAIFVPFGGEPSLTFGNGATGVTRGGLAAGGFDVTFNANVSQCTFTSSIGTPGQPGAVTPVFGGFFTYSTLLNDNTLRIFTLNQAGAPADAPFAVHVIC